jgi:hypothetical protein
MPDDFGRGQQVQLACGDFTTPMPGAANSPADDAVCVPVMFQPILCTYVHCGVTSFHVVLRESTLLVRATFLGLLSTADVVSTVHPCELDDAPHLWVTYCPCRKAAVLLHR